MAITRFGCWMIKKTISFNDTFKRRIFKNLMNSNIEESKDKIDEHKSEISSAILKYTEVIRNHMTPEIRLLLLTSNCGQALTRFVLDEGREFVSSSRKVLDLGCGCGATAIAAKLVGARRVIANDIDKIACTAVSMNSALNYVNVEVSHQNLLHELPEKSNDVIFIGDMLYDEEIAGTLIPWLEKARQNGTTIYLGDPGRHGLTKDLKKRLKIVREYSLPENVRKENYGYDKCNVWEFCG
ncbi:PREDICTED: electron transfer flavoprotein beta subunit lysine methyltransferase-like isoform X3 [Eufriesea mexicana]|uniref:electron transfer flavoprotein beta subunit lysine methyltransferase-like isoform X3 n=1 Tax=Eufriesea mexicana TaxID=516756 RepID=UPI00083C146F|nr:PREDICTED: electron transfer flavoprotein beta subunit lysine methyltransferase-like isoform X3 [Eufriesea mexicana]